MLSIYLLVAAACVWGLGASWGWERGRRTGVELGIRIGITAKERARNE